MFPVAATGLSRCTDGDCVLGGYHIPAGTEVQVCFLPCSLLVSISTTFLLWLTQSVAYTFNSRWGSHDIVLICSWIVNDTPRAIRE